VSYYVASFFGNKSNIRLKKIVIVNIHYKIMMIKMELIEQIIMIDYLK